MSTIKQPLYALLVAPDSKTRQAILSGKQKNSIREGHRNYPVGVKVMLCCHLDPWAVTVIHWDNISGALFDEYIKKAQRFHTLNEALCESLGTCDRCKERPRSWVRKTQSSNSFFCNSCARAEKDFDKEEKNCFYWTKL